MGKYDDILELPHYQSQRRAHMTLRNRAAQFAPFAALNGYGAVITEAGRCTEERCELSEEEQELLNRRLLEAADSGRPLLFCWFQPDARKSGGAYRTAAGVIRRADLLERTILLDGGERIPIDQLRNVSPAD